MTQSIESYAKQQNAYCARCWRPHPSAIGMDSQKCCTQGINCATSFDPTGKSGYAGYGSGFDMDQFFGAQDSRHRLSGLNPICDACLSELMLNGEIYDIGQSSEWGARIELPSSSSEAQAFAKKRLAQYFKELLTSSQS
jgi:hypothetical protein